MSIAERLHDGFFYLSHRGGTHKAGLWARTVVHRSNPAPGKKHYVTPHTWCCVVLGFHRDDEEASAAAPIVWKDTLPAVFLWSDENIAPQLTIHSFWSIVANCNNFSIILICSSLFFFLGLHNNSFGVTVLTKKLNLPTSGQLLRGSPRDSAECTLWTFLSKKTLLVCLINSVLRTCFPPAEYEEELLTGVFGLAVPHLGILLVRLGDLMWEFAQVLEDLKKHITASISLSYGDPLGVLSEGLVHIGSSELDLLPLSQPSVCNLSYEYKFLA